MQALRLGLARRHYASLLRGVGQIEAAEALEALAVDEADHPAARRRAISAIDAANPGVLSRRDVGDDIAGPVSSREFIGGFVLGGGLPARPRLTRAQQEQLRTLELEPIFVGVARPSLVAAIDGDFHELATQVPVESKLVDEDVPTLDGSGAVVARLARDRVVFGTD